MAACVAVWSAPGEPASAQQGADAQGPGARPDAQTPGPNDTERREAARPDAQAPELATLDADQREAQARSLFEAGNVLFRQAERARGARRTELLTLAYGRYRDSLERVQNPNALFNTAVVLEGLGRYAEAHAHYGAYEAHPEVTLAERDAAAERQRGLAPHVALVTVETEPGGAAVVVEGWALLGRPETPVTIALPAGSHRVTVLLAAHEPTELRVVAVPGHPETLQARMHPLSPPDTTEPLPEMPLSEPPAQVRLSSTVSARFFIDGERVGEGREVRVELPPGPHRLRAEAPGRLSARQTLDVQAGATVEVEASLATLRDPAPMGRAPQLTLAAAGVVGLGAAVVGVRAIQRRRDYDAAVDAYEESMSHQDLARAERLAGEATRRNRAADGLAFAAGAVGVAAVVLFALGRPVDQLPSRLEVRAHVGPGGAELVARLPLGAGR